MSTGAPTRLAHGSGPHQWGEFAAPRADDRAPPLVVFVHGGFWHAAYGLDHARPLCAGLRRAGWATLNLEYRRVGNGGGGWPGTFDDVRDGVGLVARLVDEGRVDGDRVVVAGHSAGGHLALWVASRSPVALAGVVPVAAIADLVAAWEARLSDRNTAALELMGCPPHANPDLWAAASPITQVPLPVPAILVHGADDHHVPPSQSRDYVAADRAAGGSAELREVPDDDHFAVLDPGSATFAALRDAAMDLVTE